MIASITFLLNSADVVYVEYVTGDASTSFGVIVTGNTELLDKAVEMWSTGEPAGVSTTGKFVALKQCIEWFYYNSIFYFTSLYILVYPAYILI